MLVGDLLRDSAVRAPDRLALIGNGQRLTYAEFDQQANRLANALADLKLEHGARVAILSSNRPEYAIAYFAIARTPYVSAHCSTRSVASELAYVLNKISADVLLFESDFAPVVRDTLHELGSSLTLIQLDDGDVGDVQLDGVVRMSDFVSGQSDQSPAGTIKETDGLAITLTGGTTGLPKAVLVSHKARCATATAAAEDFGLDENDILIASTPLFHTAGLFVWFGTAVMIGTTVILPQAWDAFLFIQLVQQEKVSAAFLVPSQMNDLISHAEFSATGDIATY